MTDKNLLEKLSDYLGMGAKKRRRRQDELHKLLKALKSREKKLLAKCALLSAGRKRKLLEKEIAILHVQRKKGLKALKKLSDA